MKHRFVCWLRKRLFAISLVMLIISTLTWPLAYLLPEKTQTPFIIGQSAAALIYASLTTMAVAAIDEDHGGESSTT
jgi:hypothetical protein